MTAKVRMSIRASLAGRDLQHSQLANGDADSPNANWRICSD